MINRAMQTNTVALSVSDFSVSLRAEGGDVKIVRDVSFTLEKGQTMALVGESGCGKTIAMLSLMGLIPDQQIASVSGEVLLQGAPMLGLTQDELRSLRGNRIAMIFQEAMTALNPTMTIGEQVAEPLIVHKKMKRADAMRRAEVLLSETGIDEPKRRLRQYPFEFSGGMLQRVLIAMALACEPAVIIADEPTTALDVTTQQQVLSLFKQLQTQHGTALLLITHDLGVVSHVADQVAVMYAGEIVEYGGIEEVFGNTAHPYTAALKASTPALQQRGQALTVLEGQPPTAGYVASGCAFANRCDRAMRICTQTQAPWINRVDGRANGKADGHALRCWQYHDANPQKETLT